MSPNSRKLIAAQAVVVIGLVALVYFTLLRPDDGGPPQVVDAPGEDQALVPPDERGDGEVGDRGPDSGSGGPVGEVPGATGAIGANGGAGARDGLPGPGSPGFPGVPGAPGSPGGPDDGDSGDGFGGDGDYGPGDDQYRNAVAQLQARMGLAPTAATQP